ncbi:MAG: BatD family protein [Bacteroidota bacterium]
MKKYFSILILFLTAYFLHAQKFTATVNRNKIAVGEVFQLDFNINANAKNFTPPSFNNFTIYSGPNQSSSMQIINGSISQSFSFSYYLAAKKEGTFTIGPASVIVGNNKLESNSISIEVGKGGNNQTAPGTQNSGKTQSQSSQSNNNLFARTSVSKTKVFLGEQIIVTHKVYTRLTLKGFQNVKFPSYNGFWSQELARPAQYQITTENIDGTPYNVVEIKKTFLFAQRTGMLEIEPMEIECIVREKSGKRNDIFQQFFGNDPFFGFDAYRDAVYSIKSNAIIIDVKSLPETGKPTEFTGAVGNFSMSATLDKTKVKANEGVNLKITISGKGNLKLIDSPKIKFPDGIESYDPKTNENISVSASGVSGSKTFEYLLIPRTEGTYKIESYNFNYFDSDKKSYLSLISPEFIITAEKGNAPVQAPVISTVAKEDVKLISNDIRYIKTGNFVLSRMGEYFFGSPLFYAGFFAPPLFFFAFLLFRRQYIKQNSNIVLVKKRKAKHIAKKNLAHAEKFIKSNDKENFYVNILSALYNYVSNKMNIPIADLSKEKVTQLLVEKKTTDETISQLINLLDECEFAQYSPELNTGNLQNVYNRAENIIMKVEDEIT